MAKLIEIVKDETIKVSSNVINYDKPSTIYIPYNNYTSLINLNTKVAIGTPLFKTKNNLITSPISGTTKKYQRVTTLKGELYALEIINDYEESKRLEPQKKISLNKILKVNLEKLLNLEFNLDFTNKKNLILNAIDDEPYVLTQNFYLLLNYEGFLEILDRFAKMFALDKVIICLKDTSSENISKLLECLGMYPNIELKILPNLYLLGNKTILLKYLNLKAESSLVIPTGVLYDIYNLIKRNRQKTDKLITISGNALANPSIIKVKIGTPLIDIINDIISLNTKEVTYIAGGLLTGKVIDPSNFIIDDDIDSVLIMKTKNSPPSTKCLECGACLDVCPVNINPLLLNNPNYLAKVKSKCLKCGLCSYICPAYINFNKYLNGGDHE